MYNLPTHYRADGAFGYLQGVNVLPAELSKGGGVFILSKLVRKAKYLSTCKLKLQVLKQGLEAMHCKLNKQFSVLNEE